MSCAIRATSYGNYHSLATKVLDVSLLVKYIIENSLFPKQLGQTGLRNNCVIETCLPRELYISPLVWKLIDIYKLLIEIGITTIRTTWLTLTIKTRIIKTGI